eukprot:3798088-Pyramimonas_sp.AAC.1
MCHSPLQRGMVLSLTAKLGRVRRQVRYNCVTLSYGGGRCVTIVSLSQAACFTWITVVSLSAIERTDASQLCHAQLQRGRMRYKRVTLSYRGGVCVTNVSLSATEGAYALQTCHAKLQRGRMRYKRVTLSYRGGRCVTNVSLSAGGGRVLCATVARLLAGGAGGAGADADGLRAAGGSAEHA